METTELEQSDRPEWAFHNLMRAHRLAHCSLFEQLGLRDVGQPMLLFLLDDARRDGRGCTQKGLCSALRLSASTVTASVKSLERHGYVRRHADERDMRCNIVEITDGCAAAPSPTSTRPCTAASPKPSAGRLPDCSSAWQTIFSRSPARAIRNQRRYANVPKTLQIHKGL